MLSQTKAFMEISTLDEVKVLVGRTVWIVFRYTDQVADQATDQPTDQPTDQAKLLANKK